MAVSLTNPAGHVQIPIYHHVALATGSRQVHIAGQVAWDENGNLVAPGDLTGQVAQVYRNVAKALSSVGATFHDVVRVTWYAAGWKRDTTTPSTPASNKQHASSIYPHHHSR